MEENLEKYDEQRVREEHLKLVKRINQLWDKIGFILKVIVPIAMLIGGLIVFDIFLLLYKKGIIQRWLNV